MCLQTHLYSEVSMKHLLVSFLNGRSARCFIGNIKYKKLNISIDVLSFSKNIFFQVDHSFLIEEVKFFSSSMILIRYFKSMLYFLI